MFRTILYLPIFVAIWCGGQFYIATEIWNMLQYQPTQTLFVDHKVASSSYYTDIYDHYFTKTQRFLLNQFSPLPEHVEYGTNLFPFVSISTALDAAQITDVHMLIIKSGVYDESITLPDHMILFGLDDATIHTTYTKQFHEDTIRMGDNTTLYNVNINGGDDSIVIPYHADVTLRHLTISDAHDFGIA